MVLSQIGLTGIAAPSAGKFQSEGKKSFETAPLGTPEGGSALCATVTKYLPK